MNPNAITNLFGIEGLNIAWYAVIICIGIIAGVIVARFLIKKRGYKFDVLVDFLILAIPLSVIGARVYYVVMEWDRYAGNFSKMIAIWEGGLAIYGAVIGAVIAAVIFCLWKKVPLGDILDVSAVGLILGQGIGRWGNFVNQEAFGTAVTNPAWQWFPFAVHIEKEHYISQYNELLGKMEWITCDAPWHLATFFYESLWNFIVFAILLCYFKKAKHKGNVFAMYLILYGVGRAFIEGLRTDSLWLIPGVIRTSQLLSVILVVGGIIYLLIMHKKPVFGLTYQGKYSLVTEQLAEEAAKETTEEPVAEEVAKEATEENEKEDLELSEEQNHNTEDNSEQR